MGEPAEPSFGLVLDALQADFLPVQGREIKLIQDLFGAKGQQIAVFCYDNIDDPSATEVSQLSICLVRSYYAFVVSIFELLVQFVSNIWTDINGVDHLLETLLEVPFSHEILAALEILLSPPAVDT